MAIVINAEGLILGRIAATVAKKLLEGEKVEIVNAEKAIVSGRKEYVFQKYDSRFKRGPKGNPTKGPQNSRLPDRILRSAVRNMLPKYSKRGRKVLKNLRVWIGIPKPLEAEKTQDLEEAKKTSLQKTVTLGEISKMCGASF